MCLDQAKWNRAEGIAIAGSILHPFSVERLCEKVFSALEQFVEFSMELISPRRGEPFMNETFTEVECVRLSLKLFLFNALLRTALIINL